MGTINFSDIVRQYISDTHQRDPTYFSSKTITERNQDFKVYCELNKTNGLIFSKHRPILSQELAKQKELLKLKMDGGNSKVKSEKFVVTKGQQKGNIKVNPTQTQPTTSTTTTTTQPTTQPTTSTGLQIVDPNAPKIIVPHPLTCQCTECQLKRGEITPLEPEEAGGIIEIFIDFWHSRNPDVELMTDEEVKRVGKRLAPILQRHVGGDILLYGLGIVTIGQVIMKRVDQSKKGKKKDKVKDTQDKANEKTSTDDSKTETQTETEPIVHRKFFSSKKIRALEKMGDENDE